MTQVEDVPEDISSGAGKAWGAVENFGSAITGGFDRAENRVCSILSPLILSCPGSIV